jgi:hypothetical protein
MAQGHISLSAKVVALGYRDREEEESVAPTFPHGSLREQHARRPPQRPPAPGAERWSWL